MRISYVVNTRMPNQRAHGFQIGKTCEKLAELGHEVELWYPYRVNDLHQDVFEYYGLARNFTLREISGIDVVFLDKWIGSLAFSLQAFFFAFSLLRRGPARGSLIYTRDIFLAVLFAFRGYSVVYNVHNWSRKRAIFSKLFLSKKTKIVCNSEGTRRTLTQNGFANVLAVPNGVDLKDFEGTEDRTQLRTRLGLPKDIPIALYAGGLYPWKGIDIMIDAARLLLDARNLLFVIVGGDENDLRFYGKKAEGLSNVLFVGHRQKKDVPVYMKAADVLLLPTIPESDEAVSHTSPIKLFEYMASGVPIVASDLPSTREIADEEDAVLVEPGDPRALVRAIVTTLDDSSSASKRASRARETVRRYSWDAYAEKIARFLQE